MKIIQNFLLLLCMTTFLFCSKKDATPGNNTPPANLTVSAVVSTDSSGNVAFTSAAENAVSFDYYFGDGTHQTVSSGAVTYKYPASGTYTVNVTARNAGGLPATTSIQVTVAVAMALIWADEFDTTGSPSATNWGYDIGTGGGGWGNNELEYYTDRTTNAYVSNGTLKIMAVKENYSGSAYTSARLLTKNKFNAKYGKIEARIKLPAGAGTWPAFWMLGSNIDAVSWPACGEMDIMEEKGNEPGKIYATLHYPGRSGANGDGSTTSIQNSGSEFHRYAEEWSPVSIKIMVDDVVYYTFANNSSTPFNQNFFIILNLAIGGNFGGAVDPLFMNATMEVDYVRVYQ